MTDPDVVLAALERVGNDVTLRQQVIDALVAWEARNLVEGEDLRSQVTGPIVDALHAGQHSIDCMLENALGFTIPYDSRIARDVAMGRRSPTHVWEPQTTRLLVQLARSCQLVVIGGAYVGDHAVPIAKAMPQGSVLCFEIQPHYAAALRQNAHRNAAANIEVVEAGLWSSPGRLTLTGTDVVASPVEELGEGQGFPAVTIDGFLAERGAGRADLIMLDIEGGEHQALLGAVEQLSRPGRQAPTLVFEVHRHFVDWSQGLHATPLMQFIEGLGYTVFGIRDYQANIEIGDQPIEVVELDGIYLDGPPHGFNVVAIKDTSLVDEWGLIVRNGVSPKLLVHRTSYLHQPGMPPGEA